MDKGDTHTHGENLYVYEPMVKGDTYKHTHTEKTYVSMNQWIKEIHINTHTHTHTHTLLRQVSLDPGYHRCGPQLASLSQPAGSGHP